MQDNKKYTKTQAEGVYFTCGSAVRYEACGTNKFTHVNVNIAFTTIHLQSSFIHPSCGVNSATSLSIIWEIWEIEPTKPLFPGKKTTLTIKVMLWV